MMKDKEFYVPYIEGSLGNKTKRKLKYFVVISILFILTAAILFSFSQKPFKNSTFELSSNTKISGTYHENPYPMLRVEIAENTFKNILLLGFGKSSANPFLEKLQDEVKDLNNKTLSIEGNLIYYNGKTLLQITDEEKVILVNDTGQNLPNRKIISEMTLQGEIIDPKCYFGVMKPGFGKIHRSCAVRCISGGIPPVFATSDENNISKYYLITDIDGKAMRKDILSFIGKPCQIKGIVEKIDDWYFFKIDPQDISILSEHSNIY